MGGGGFQAGRLFGINIRIDWSWFLIFVLVIWNLVTAFGQFHPDWSSEFRWGLAVVAALLFFLSVLAHELSHALVAKAFDLPVKNITLFLFGGVANIQREPTSPRMEFLVAIAGPLSSLIIGGMALGIARTGLAAGATGIGSAVSRLSAAQTVLLWLGSVNLILAIFNLIPGFPLDGGRVLRSILWGVTRNLRVATRIASWAGQLIAWTMIVGGIAMVFGVNVPWLGSGVVSGLWLVFIGWFLHSASTQSYQQVAIKGMLSGITVSNLMRSNPPTIEPDCTINDLMHIHLMNSDSQAFPVLDQENLVGIVTLDDVRRAPRDQWEQMHVNEIMTPLERLVITTPDEDVSFAMDKLIQRDIRQLPVVTNGKELIGLLRLRDIMRWLQMKSEYTR